MNEKIAFLISSIGADMAAIEDVYAKLEQNLGEADQYAGEVDEDRLIVRAYYLHSLYSAFENIFQNIAAAFENSIDEVDRWHAQLLERMQLEVPPIRPAVIDGNAYDALDELRRFRHLFRHTYTLRLDRDRLDLVVRKALQLQEIYRQQLDRFLQFLEDHE